MKLLVWLLFPFALLYALVTSVRNTLFELKLWKSQHYSKPTIGVGNLSMGGTGKSVVIAYLIARLKKERSLAVLSRGYKRKTKGYLLADKTSTAQTIGDEPYQFFQNHPEIKVAVAEKRALGMEQLLKLQPSPEVFLWDDVFQHRHVTPKLLILTTTFLNPYYKDCVFPMGTLRERRQGSKRANIILMTKCPENLSPKEANQIRKKLKLQDSQQLFFTTIQYDLRLKGEGGMLSLENLQKERFLLVCGIANPQPMISFLKAQGCQFEPLIYPDHYNFNTNALEEINRKGQGKKIITTEKDYGRLAPHLKRNDLYYLPIQMKFVFSEDQIAFDSLIQQAVE